eukprot:m51a1_g8721 hypothetical protein (136) ;mRNA; r:174554-175070
MMSAAKQMSSEPLFGMHIFGSVPIERPPQPARATKEEAQAAQRAQEEDQAGDSDEIARRLGELEANNERLDRAVRALQQCVEEMQGSLDTQRALARCIREAQQRRRTARAAPLVSLDACNSNQGPQQPGPLDWLK